MELHIREPHREIAGKPDANLKGLIPARVRLADYPQHKVRTDQYGIHTMLQVADQPIKFEIVFEARMALSPPGAKDQVCGIATLTPLDMAASKLLANSDRCADDGVFSRDVIDLAMMSPSLHLLRNAIVKAETAYGDVIRRDLRLAIQRLKDRPGRLERCIEALDIKLPKAAVWKNLRALRRVLD